MQEIRFSQIIKYNTVAKPLREYRTSPVPDQVNLGGVQFFIIKERFTDPRLLVVSNGFFAQVSVDWSYAPNKSSHIRGAYLADSPAIRHMYRARGLDHDMYNVLPVQMDADCLRDSLPVLRKIRKAFYQHAVAMFRERRAATPTKVDRYGGYRASKSIMRDIKTRTTALTETMSALVQDLRAYRKANPSSTRIPVSDVIGMCQEQGLTESLQSYVDYGLPVDSVIANINASIKKVSGRYMMLTRAACGHIEFSGRLRDTRRDGQVCSACADDDYVVDYRGDLIHQDRAYEWSDGEYHDSLEHIHDDDDDSGRSPDQVLDYSTDVLRYLTIDPTFKSSSGGDFHMGIELETILTGKNESHERVRKVRRELGADYLVGKYDGSLSSARGSGIEWVTRPTSLAVHIDKLSKWSDTTNNLVAWDARCCGMHVHIDSKAFTALTLGKMLQFFNKEDNAQFIRKIAGRHPDTDHQAKTYAGRDIDAAATRDPVKALKGKGSSRYTMVNTSNIGRRESERLHISNAGGDYNTVEIRIFRASMRKERLLAQIEFAHALVVFCRFTGFRNLTGADFTKWLAGVTRAYPNLAKFLDVQPHKHGKPTKAPVAVASGDETIDLTAATTADPDEIEDEDEQSDAAMCFADDPY